MRYLVGILLIIIVLFTGCSADAAVEGEKPTKEPSNSCPHGLVDDPYPGSCGLYVDKDKNNICDHSE